MRDLPKDLTPSTRAAIEAGLANGEPQELGNMPIATYRDFAEQYQFKGDHVCDGVTMEERGLAIGESGAVLTVRIFTPDALADNHEAPFCVYFPGGGFVTDLGSHKLVNSRMAAEAGCKVIQVNTRIAPEHKFPHGVNDAYQAVQYIHEHPEEFGIGTKSFALAGDSSGGNFALLVAQRLRDEGAGFVSNLLLVNPTTDFSRSTHKFDRQEKVDAVPPDLLAYLFDQYIEPGIDRQDPKLSPLFADQAGLPPTDVMVAMYDIIRNDSEALADKLRAQGVPSTLTVSTGKTHAFFTRTDLFPDGDDPIAVASAKLRNRMQELTSTKTTTPVTSSDSTLKMTK